jgi:hypothetical protein
MQLLNKNATSFKICRETNPVRKKNFGMVLGFTSTFVPAFSNASLRLVNTSAPANCGTGPLSVANGYVAQVRFFFPFTKRK